MLARVTADAGTRRRNGAAEALQSARRPRSRPLPQPHRTRAARGSSAPPRSSPVPSRVGRARACAAARAVPAVPAGHRSCRRSLRRRPRARRVRSRSALAAARCPAASHRRMRPHEARGSPRALARPMTAAHWPPPWPRAAARACAAAASAVRSAWRAPVPRSQPVAAQAAPSRCGRPDTGCRAKRDRSCADAMAADRSPRPRRVPRSPRAARASPPDSAHPRLVARA